MSFFVVGRFEGALIASRYLGTWTFLANIAIYPAEDTLDESSYLTFVHFFCLVAR